MSKHTLEQVLEALINKEDDRASELLHQFFVAKGKSIYEELSELDNQLEEDELEEGFGAAPSEDFEDEIIADETELDDESLFAEADDEEPEDAMAADEPTEPEATADLAMGGDEEPAGDGLDMGAEDGAEGGDAEEVLQKADDAIEELKAIFAELMGNTAGADADTGADMPDMGAEETEESFRAFGESAKLSAVSPAQMGDDGDKSARSPVSSGPKVSDQGAKPVKTNTGTVKAGTEGGLAKPSAAAINTGNVNVPGNKKAPAYKNVAVPKNSDSASNKTSPVAKG
jgi:hypothetical protein